MSINAISQTDYSKKKKPFLNAKNTGYTAVAGIAFSVASGFSKNSTVKKSHKLFAGLSLASIIAHIAVLKIGAKKFKEQTALNKES